MGTGVLLIKPDFPDIAVMPPLGLGYLAASLGRAGIGVRVHDNTLHRYGDRELAGLLSDLAPEVVGIYAATPMIRRALEIAALVRRFDARVLIALGGPHPSETAEEILAHGAVDVIAVGEGEKTLVEIVARFREGSRDFAGIEGCAYLGAGGQPVRTPPRARVVDLDSLPFPDLDIMPVPLYFKKGASFGILQGRGRSIPIMASRGCPSTCTFCQKFLGTRFRIRSADNIVDELAYRRKTHGVSEFNFLDDNFTLHRKRVLEVCDLIHRKGLNIRFRFPNGVREDFLDDAILDALKSVGCYHLDFGIESGSQKVLDLMRKGKKVEEIAAKVVLGKRKGFKLSASFLFGTPGETLDDMEDTIRFALSLPLDSASFGIVIPFPGTELRAEAIRKGILAHSDYDFYNPNIDNFRPPIETPDWSARDLLAMQKRASRAFFLRPRKVISLLPTMVSPVNLKRFGKALFEVMRG